MPRSRARSERSPSRPPGRSRSEDTWIERVSPPLSTRNHGRLSDLTTPYASEPFLHQILGKALAAGGSDVHLKVGQPPGARVRDDLVFFRVDKIKPEDTEAALRILLGVPAGAPLSPTLDIVFAYDAP